MAKTEQEIEESARLYAEGQMPDEWDRKDGILIAVFYNHMIDYYAERLAWEIEYWKGKHDATANMLMQEIEDLRNRNPSKN
jgi:hypothetical protein